ncbi:MAG: response regulator [Armatimonadota bacterium]|nr:response regulator [Armatimonadota bacterium]
MKRLPRVLVVDDQPPNLTLVRRVLQPAGFEVSEARSGAEALALAQETQPDLILLDMHLPDLHGLDVLRKLRENPRSAAIRVLAMSALAAPEDREAWLQAGCLGTVEKPINVRTFPQEIAAWLPGAAPGPDDERARSAGQPDRLGELLVANMLITPDQLQQAMAAQARSGKRLGQVLVEQGALSEDDLAWALSHQLGYPYVYLSPEIIDAETARLLPEAFVRDRRVLPILKFGQEMTLAMVDPTDQQTVDEITARTGLQVRRALALSSNIEQMQDWFFPNRSTPSDSGTPTVGATEAQYFQFHLVQALQQGGTEIHFDPGPDGAARVRYRLQGVLVDRPGQPADLHAGILRHLRHITGAGGAAGTTATVTLPVGDRDVMLVGTFLPTMYGEAATVVVQPLHADVPDLPALGVSEELIQPVREALQAASGVVVVGCADRWVRSTLLHGLVPAGLRGKIWALEAAPVYRRSTINQTVRAPGADVAPTIAAAGEAGADLVIVDDTSSRPAQAAVFEAGRTRVLLAGHAAGEVVSVLSEALDAVGPALVASTLRAIVAACAVRLLCPACKQPVSGDAGPFRGARTFAPTGCETCGFTGFKGRRLLLDVWCVDASSRRMLRVGRAGEVVERVLEDGSRIYEAGRALVLDGLTSADELARVLGWGLAGSR